MNVIIAEDQIPITHTLKGIVNEIFPSAAVHTFENLTQAIDFLRENQIDLIISDLDFKEGKRFNLAEEARAKNIPCIIYTLYHNKIFTDEARRLKVRSFVCKRGPLEYLESAIKHYNREGCRLCNTTRELQLESKSQLTQRIIFTKREQEFLEGLIDGLSFSEIAKKYDLKHSTIKSYSRNLIRKHNMPLRSLIANYINWNHRK